MAKVQKYNNLIIDGQNFCYRAGVVDTLSNRDDKPVSVIYLSLLMLRSLVEKYQPERVIVAWDHSHNLWRKEQYPEYKVKSKSTPEQKVERDKIFIQMNVVREKIFPMFPILQWRVDGQEADDLVYAAAMQCRGHSLIVSSDKDYLQMLDIADTLRTVQEDPYTYKDFEHEYGFVPTNWPQYRAIVGDPSDNIPGVRGIGEVGAKKILQAYGEAVEYCERYPGKNLSNKIEEGRESLKLFRSIIDFEQLPDTEELQGGFLQIEKEYKPTLDEASIKKYFMLNGFVSMLKEYTKWMIPFKRLAR